MPAGARVLALVAFLGFAVTGVVSLARDSRVGDVARAPQASPRAAAAGRRITLYDERDDRLDVYGDRGMLVCIRDVCKLGEEWRELADRDAAAAAAAARQVRRHAAGGVRR